MAWHNTTSAEGPPPHHVDRNTAHQERPQASSKPRNTSEGNSTSGAGEHHQQVQLDIRRARRGGGKGRRGVNPAAGGQARLLAGEGGLLGRRRSHPRRNMSGELGHADPDDRDRQDDGENTMPPPQLPLSQPGRIHRLRHSSCLHGHHHHIFEYATEPQDHKREAAISAIPTNPDGQPVRVDPQSASHTPALDRLPSSAYLAHDLVQAVSRSLIID
jgi:hypothetical protein